MYNITYFILFFVERITQGDEAPLFLFISTSSLFFGSGGWED